VELSGVFYSIWLVCGAQKEKLQVAWVSQKTVALSYRILQSTDETEGEFAGLGGYMVLE
jgi:hypothetical protein